MEVGVKYWGQGWLLACLVGGWFPQCAWAQMPAVKHYTAQTGLVIPVRIDDAKRAQFKALQLYVRNGPGQPWVCAETAAPSVKQFTYRVPQDGEFWFSVVAVNQAGQSFPRDVEREPPELMVVVDSKAPQFDLRVLTLEDNTIVLQCDIYDANPDLNKTKIEYSTFPSSWKTLESETRAFCCFRLPDLKVLAGQVRVTLGDRAGNVTSRMVSLASARPFSVTDSTALLAATARRLQPEAEAAESQARMQYVRNPHVSLAYELEAASADDVSKVEVWYTADQGQSWHGRGRP